MYRIYTIDRDGKHLIEETESYRVAEIYLETCKNVLIEDSANDETDTPQDKTLFAAFLPSWGACRIALDDCLSSGGIGSF